MLRNFPLIGHGRYLMEMIRPEVSQYFIELDTGGQPFSREERSVIYRRAKALVDTVPFGSRQDPTSVGHEWLNYSLRPGPLPAEEPRVLIGGEQCKRPYAASLLNISALSFGAMSANAVLALNAGARMGGFAHNTGEGGISPYHLESGGDLIWQIGTGYFGCRTREGRFDPEAFRDKAARDSVRMIEVKLSQGAKPGYGGLLPGAKVSPEIARIRGVEPGRDVQSPASHSAFSTPVGLLEFIARLRELSGGKPVGFKLCVGRDKEFLGICKAMLKTGILPDFIAVDGGEGGTGAAPLEFVNAVGTPLELGLAFVRDALCGTALRDRVRLIAGGRITTGFHIVSKLALGTDLCYSARGMMFALGCIQALRCNTNRCPVGVATQKPALVQGLVVEDKTVRVANYHRATIHSMLELVAAAGVSHPDEIRPFHISRRVSTVEVRDYTEIFPYPPVGSLLDGDPSPGRLARAWREASAESF